MLQKLTNYSEVFLYQSHRSKMMCGIPSFPIKSLCNSYLGEIAHKMTAFLIILCKYVEEERLHIIIQGLVIQEKLG